MAPQPALASKFPQAVDSAWEAIGGGPPDLAFPDNFIGVWTVQSLLTSVELPLGPEFVPDMRAVQRAQTEDSGQTVVHEAAFIRNSRDQVVMDRRFNTASLMHTYLGMDAADVAQRIAWDVDDPNLLEMRLPNRVQVSQRITRRSEEWPNGSDRLSTSEYFQQVLQFPDRPEPKVKASQAFTKYHWRSPEMAAGGPEIVATQVVSDFLGPYDSATLLMKANGKAVTVYNYKLTFARTG